jgi:hypothetical protein
MNFHLVHPDENELGHDDVVPLQVQFVIFVPVSRVVADFRNPGFVVDRALGMYKRYYVGNQKPILDPILHTIVSYSA